MKNRLAARSSIYDLARLIGKPSAPSCVAMLLALALSACNSLFGPGKPGEVITPGRHTFQCHPASPGPCAYVIFNESGSVRETFVLAPGKTHEVSNIHPRTTFCLAVEKPLDPSKCERLGLDGKPLQK